MIRSRWWVLPGVASIVLLAAGCGGGGGGGQATTSSTATAAPRASATPASGPVMGVQAICGVQGVFWQGRWWADDLPIQTVRGETPTRLLSGTMTTTDAGHARLDSPDLVAPQTLYATPNTNPSAPPFQACEPLVH